METIDHKAQDTCTGDTSGLAMTQEAKKLNSWAAADEWITMMRVDALNQSMMRNISSPSPYKEKDNQPSFS